jgi:(2Fe-2S) ferredoxin
LGEQHRPLNSASCTGPIFLTCTNGRRDACCAKWGREMASAMTEAADHEAWQTTHLGGHRFAPTLLVLPHGSQYGWLEPDDAEPLVKAHQAGRLYRADRYRGHVGFSRPVQAAAAFLRDEIDDHRLEALALVRATRGAGTTEHQVPGHEPSGGTASLATTSLVRLRVGTTTYEVEVRHEEGQAVPSSCGADPTPSERLTPVRYQVI